jgi:hypothetical protein
MQGQVELHFYSMPLLSQVFFIFHSADNQANLLFPDMRSCIASST